MTAKNSPLECFVTTGSDLRIRVRLLGSGPALVMCHESPRSGAALLPLAYRICDRFTCVMIDTPGFGLSEPLLRTRPEIPQYASVVLDVVAQLGIEQAPFYGTHTGAAIAIEAAVQAPAMVSAVYLDGYALFSETERDELLASYLTPIEHTLDGSHVAWLWSRVRDQFTAFPWHRVADAGRLPYGPPPIETLQAVVDDFLLADDHYRAAYAAAFRYDHLAPVQQARVPVYLTARSDDLLLPHLQNAVGLPDNVTVETLPADRDAWGRRIADLLAPHADGQDTSTSALSVLSSRQGVDDKWHIANTSVATVVLRFDGSPAAPPVVLLHDSPGDMSTLDSLAEHLADTCRVIRLDLPGLGVSRLHEGVEPTLENLSIGVTEALKSLGIDNAPIVTFGASLSVASGMLDVKRLIVDPWHLLCEASAEVPELAPRWDGAHLFAAFYWARDYDLYKPWYHRANAQGRKLGGERDVEQTHKRYRAVVLAGATGALATAALYRGRCTAAQRGSAELQILLYRDDPDREALQHWALAVQSAESIQTVSRAPDHLAASIVNSLNQMRSA